MIKDSLCDLRIMLEIVQELTLTLPTIDPDEQSAIESVEFYETCKSVKKAITDYCKAVENEFMFQRLRSLPGGIRCEDGKLYRLAKKKESFIRNESRTVENIIKYAGGSLEYFNSSPDGVLKDNPWRITNIRRICGDDHIGTHESENLSVQYWNKNL